jgi:CheY-like chemotaxis protein
MSDKEILYIEDNFHNRRIVRKILERQGYTLHEREDGLQGYEFLKELKPGVVLLDISLPSMDGMEIARRVKEDPAVQHIYLIALTASAMQGDRERFLDAGCDDYLSKPFRALDLVELVNKYAELVAANVPAPPPQPSEMHDTGPLQAKKVEVAPEPVEVEAEAQIEPEADAVDEQESLEVPQIEEAVEAEAAPEIVQGITAAPEPVEEVEEAAVEPAVELPTAEVEEIEPIAEAVEAVDETPVENAGEVEETPEVMEPIEVEAEVEAEPEAEVVVEQEPVEVSQVEEVVEPVEESEPDQTVSAAPEPVEEIEEAVVETVVEMPVAETLEPVAYELTPPAVEVEEIEPAAEVVEAVDDTPSEDAGVFEETPEVLEPVEQPAYVEPAAQAPVVEETLVAEEVGPEADQAMPSLEEETPLEETPAVEEKIQTAGLDQESIDAGLKKLEDDTVEPEEQLTNEEPTAEAESEYSPSLPAVVAGPSKENGNWGAKKKKNTEEIDAIKAGIMGVINPDNLRPVDPNNHQE